MRITSGMYTSRTLEELPNSRSINRKSKFDTRPTSDRVRQAIFNILNHANWDIGNNKFFDMKETYALDAFAGTGALGIEAISNGSIDCCFIEIGPKAFEICEKNVGKFKIQEKSHLFKSDSLKIYNRPSNIKKRNLVFLDPPYGRKMILESIDNLIKNDWISENTILILEEDKNNTEEMPHNFKLLNSKIYGKASVKIFLIE